MHSLRKIFLSKIFKSKSKSLSETEDKCEHVKEKVEIEQAKDYLYSNGYYDDYSNISDFSDVSDLSDFSESNDCEVPYLNGYSNGLDHDHLSSKGKLNNKKITIIKSNGNVVCETVRTFHCNVEIPI